MPKKNTVAETAKTAPTKEADVQTVTGLRERLAALEQLDAGQLRTEWRRLFRAQAPRVSRDLLVRGLAYRLQEVQLGGLSKAIRRKLATLAKELEASGSLSPATSPQLRPGARLVREWRGRTHTVAVVDGGFEYGGTVYGSLTKIAQTITGAHWSGPRFFGLIESNASGDSNEDEDRGSRRRGRADADRGMGGTHV